MNEITPELANFFGVCRLIAQHCQKAAAKMNKITVGIPVPLTGTHAVKCVKKLVIFAQTVGCPGCVHSGNSAWNNNSAAISIPFNGAGAGHEGDVIATGLADANYIGNIIAQKTTFAKHIVMLEQGSQISRMNCQKMILRLYRRGQGLVIAQQSGKSLIPPEKTFFNSRIQRTLQI